MEVVLLRHAERVDETPERHAWAQQCGDRWWDPPLTDKGKRQSREAGDGRAARCRLSSVRSRIHAVQLICARARREVGTELEGRQLCEAAHAAEKEVRRLRDNEREARENFRDGVMPL